MHSTAGQASRGAANDETGEATDVVRSAADVPVYPVASLEGTKGLEAGAIVDHRRI